VTRRRRTLDGWADKPPMVVTKRLVAHRPPDPSDELGVRYGPRDGDPVGVPAPCARLIVGYWCSCGSGFASLGSHEPISRARVEEAPDGEWRGYVDSYGGSLEPGVRWPTESDRRYLQEVVEALPVGTVVERFGTGIAPRFGDPDPRAQPWISAGDYSFRLSGAGGAAPPRRG
jgi:hypothetical protein